MVSLKIRLVAGLDFLRGVVNFICVCFGWLESGQVCHKACSAPPCAFSFSLKDHTRIVPKAQGCVYEPMFGFLKHQLLSISLSRCQSQSPPYNKSVSNTICNKNLESEGRTTSSWHILLLRLRLKIIPNIRYKQFS